MKKSIGMTLLLVALSAMISSAALAAKEPILSLRFNSMGPEAEIHISNVGIGVSYMPINQTEGACTATGSKVFEFARYFIKGAQDSWYLGVAAYQVKVTISANCTVTTATDGGLPMIGYHWLWDSGFNVDLGLRPGFLALGFSF